MTQFLRPNIVLLKEGTDTSQGVPQIIANIGACVAVGDIVKTTLGPRGMDKLIHDDSGVTVTNDGATVMKKLNIVHPAAKLMADISHAQDCEVGDGTTSVVILCTEFLKEAKEFLEDGLPPQAIIRGYRKACSLALSKLQDISINLSNHSHEDRMEMLVKCAETTLSSKLVFSHRKVFAEMVVKAVGMLDDDLPLNMIGIKKIAGGNLSDCQLIDGVAFKKTFSYAGFEQQPKCIDTPMVLLLNVELELKAEKDNAEVRISNPGDYQHIVNAEWNVIYEKLTAIADSGATVVLSRLPVGDLATQFFADRGIFSAGRVEDGDLVRTAKATNAVVQSTVHGISPEVLGTCKRFEERQLGAERYNFFLGCESGKSATIVLRGGAQQFVDETERSLHDAIMVVRRATKSSSIVGGGGSIELEISRFLTEYSLTVSGANQLVIAAYARALESIPLTLAANSGADALDLLTKLRSKHAQDGGRWFGVDCFACDIIDAVQNFIWEPMLVKRNALLSATEAACLILSIDETVKNPQSEKPGGGAPGRR